MSYRRISVTLPEETIRLMDRVSRRGGRGKLVNEAVLRYIGGTGSANLRKRLQQGYLRTAKRDLRILADWL